MKKNLGFLVSCILGTLVIGGCSNKEVVKKDEEIAPSATTQTKKQIDKIVKNDSSVTSMPIKEAQKSSKMDMSNNEAKSKEQFKSGLDKIYFDFDSYDLSDQSRKTLTSDAEYLQKKASTKVRIEGNCDERGSAEYNIALGEKRAKAAMKYLVTLGVPVNNIETISYGKEKPADPGHDEAAWAKNRRDDFVILSK